MRYYHRGPFILNADGMTFIFKAHLIFKGRQETTTSILAEGNLSIDRCPVSMNIKYRKEDSYFFTFFMEEGILIDIGNVHNLAVRRRENQVIPFWDNPFRITEEIGKEEG